MSHRLCRMGLRSRSCAGLSSSSTPNWGNPFFMDLALCTCVLSWWKENALLYELIPLSSLDAVSSGGSAVISHLSPSPSSFPTLKSNPTGSWLPPPTQHCTGTRPFQTNWTERARTETTTDPVVRHLKQTTVRERLQIPGDSWGFTGALCNSCFKKTKRAAKMFCFCWPHLLVIDIGLVLGRLTLACPNGTHHIRFPLSRSCSTASPADVTWGSLGGSNH